MQGVSSCKAEKKLTKKTLYVSQFVILCLKQLDVQRLLVQCGLKLQQVVAPGEGLLQDEPVPEEKGESRGERLGLDVEALRKHKGGGMYQLPRL